MSENNSDDNEKKHDGFEEDLKGIAKFFVLVGAFLLGGGYLLFAFIALWSKSQSIIDIALLHTPIVFGLPSAVLISLWVVVFLENTSGPIEFEALGIKFKGASGPVILWVIGMLSISIAIKLLWLG